MGSKLKYIDLFAGASGLSEGFKKAGFEPVAHVEMDKAACFTIRTRIAYHYLKSKGEYNSYVNYLKGLITRTGLYDLIPSDLLDSVINLPIGGENNPKIHKIIEQRLNGDKVDLIIGGPPCQAYSLVGRARSKDGMKSDPRNYLYVQYAKYLERYAPKMFVFENVIGLKSANQGEHLKNMRSLFLNKGYEMHDYTVEANNFGVLQNRKRVIIIGWRAGMKHEMPDLEKIKIENKFLVKEVLEDLPKIKSGGGINKFSKYSSGTNEYLKDRAIRNGIEILTQHVARPHSDQDKEIYRIAVNKWNNNKERLDYNDLPEKLKTHKNRHSFFDRFKVVAKDLPHSQTVVAHIAKDGHYYIHPDLQQNRSLTIREAARLQSFPDDFYFEGVKEEGSRTAAFKQIGNAVPPFMAFKIACILKQTLND